MINIIQQVILIIGTFFGGITDFKTGYIYDWITIPMILLGLILSIIQGQLFNIYSGITIFILLLIGYKLGKIGGGDVKIFTGIALLNPINQADFLITVFFFATISAIIFYSTYYSVKYFKKGINFEREKKGIHNSIIIAFILILYFFMMISFNIITEQFLFILIIPLGLGLLYYALQKGIKEEFFEKKVLIKNLEEDEILGEKNNLKIKKLFKLKYLIGEKEILLLKRNNIKEIFVLRNLPKFGPFIFIGTIIAIIWPEFVMFLFI
jgi:prepilin signal peptidase PulO-like enzyme (type II secretory pathway)